jgi:hypothetical protein
LTIKLAALAAGGRAEQRTAEYRISNRKISKDGFAALSLFLNRQNTSLRYSTFMIRYSIFAFSKFLSRLNWPLFRLKVVVNTTATLYYKNMAFTWWERLPAAINDGSTVLQRYSRLEAAPTKGSSVKLKVSFYF